MTNKINELDWALITERMNSNGYAIVSKILSSEQCEEIIEMYQKRKLFRKMVIMERHRFGKGAYKYFDYPLPEIVQELRESIYSKLSPIANQWMNALNIDTLFPSSLPELTAQCHSNEQKQPTPLLLTYSEGGFNTLHQDLYGAIYFPMQTVFFLNRPDQDFIGGEFVMTQQTPRAQSKAIVLKPRKGDMLVFTTNFRPVKGARGYYRVNMKHGVSEIKSGQRNTLGIIFHDAHS